MLISSKVADTADKTNAQVRFYLHKCTELILCRIMPGLLQLEKSET